MAVLRALVDYYSDRPHLIPGAPVDGVKRPTSAAGSRPPSEPPSPTWRG